MCVSICGKATSKETTMSFLVCFKWHITSDIIWTEASQSAKKNKDQDSRRVKIGPVTKIDEVWLHCVCTSSVTENDFFKSGVLFRHL